MFEFHQKFHKSTALLSRSGLQRHMCSTKVSVLLLDHVFLHHHSSAYLPGVGAQSPHWDWCRTFSPGRGWKPPCRVKNGLLMWQKNPLLTATNSSDRMKEAPPSSHTTIHMNTISNVDKKKNKPSTQTSPVLHPKCFHKVRNHQGSTEAHLKRVKERFMFLPVLYSH